MADRDEPLFPFDGFSNAASCFRVAASWGYELRSHGLVVLLLILSNAIGCSESRGKSTESKGKSTESRGESDAAVIEVSCDVRALFAADGVTGVGCSGAICHGSTVVSLDLKSPGLETRLFNEPADPVGACAGELLVDGDDPGNSLLLKKIDGTSTCGQPMPYLKPSALSRAQVQCIREYVQLVASGGSE